MTTKTKNEFDLQIANNVRITIALIKRHGTTAMGLANLRQITPTPKTTNGAPIGGNTEWQYAQRFEAVVRANPSFRKFLL